MIISKGKCFILTMMATLIPVAGAAAATGDLWEVTSKMSVEGMPTEMPGITMKVCSPKEWKEPPAPADERQKCEYSDFKVEGAKATWKVKCADPEMTGEGEITRNGPDAWAGVMKFAGSEMAMAMKLNGKRLGDCDPPKP